MLHFDHADFDLIRRLEIALEGTGGDRKRNLQRIGSWQRTLGRNKLGKCSERALM